MKNETDVVIVGAGPTGLALACQFVRYGVDFVVIDKNEGPTPFSKALGVHARTMEIYDQIGLARTAIERGAVAKRVRWLAGGEVRGELDFSNVGQGMSPFPYILVLEQSENERLMYEFVRAHGREVDWRTSLDHLSQDGSGITVSYTGPDGSAGEIKAKYVVGCDGAKSKVRNELGMSFSGSTFERIFYVADVSLDCDLDHEALHACVARDAFVLFFPMRGDRHYRIVGVFPEDAQELEGDELYTAIERHVLEQSELRLDITEVKWFSSYKVHTRRVDRFSNGRGFVAGDAAHIHSPAGAQGMNTGIQDAYNLAWKMAFVMKGQALPALLDTYNEERLENAQRLLETTDRMFQLGAGSEWFISILRIVVFPPLAGFVLSFDAVKKFIFPILSQIGITYRDCRLSDHRGDTKFDVKAGDRMPYFLVDGQNVYDRLREPKFHLITFADGQTNDHELAQRANSEWADRLDHQSIPLFPAIADKFGSESSFHVLLRPDNYIALIVKDGAFSAVDDYLRGL